jgi:hypothetical protein
MRQLDNQERDFISLFLITGIIIAIPFSTFIELTRQPLDDWGREILKTNEPPATTWADQVAQGNYTNIYLAVLWLIIDVGKLLLILPFIYPTIRLVQRFGWQINDIPDRWKPYIYFQCKTCKSIYKKRSEFIKHKKEMSCTA